MSNHNMANGLMTKAVQTGEVSDPSTVMTASTLRMSSTTVTDQVARFSVYELMKDVP